MLCNNAVAKVMLLMYIPTLFFYILLAMSRFLTFNKFFCNYSAIIGIEYQQLADFLL